MLLHWLYQTIAIDCEFCFKACQILALVDDISAEGCPGQFVHLGRAGSFAELDL